MRTTRNRFSDGAERRAAVREPAVRRRRPPEQPPGCECAHPPEALCEPPSAEARVYGAVRQ